MNINERQNLIAKIIADLELLIAESWNIDMSSKLEKALEILKENTNLEGYDD